MQERKGLKPVYELKLTSRLVFPSAAFQVLGLGFKHSLVAISHFYCSAPPKHVFPFHHSFFPVQRETRVYWQEAFPFFILASWNPFRVSYHLNEYH